MLPLLLSPVLGNPVSLAAVGVDGSKPLQEQVSARLSADVLLHMLCRRRSTSQPTYCMTACMTKQDMRRSPCLRQNQSQSRSVLPMRPASDSASTLDHNELWSFAP